MSRIKVESDQFRISTAESKDDIGGCFETMRVLRTELDNRDNFVAQVRRQQESSGYVLLAALANEGFVVGVAGFRPQENLMHGFHLYVDDLVTAEVWRNCGIGAALMETIIKRGSANGCTKVLLDTGALNVAAHRFYAGLGFTAKALRFSLDLF
jgi:ribosomal protein S18 acetylase RimI-like enzyme